MSGSTEQYQGVCSWEGVAELSATPTTPSLLYNNLTESNGLLVFCSGSHVSVVRINPSAVISDDAECIVQGEQASLVASIELKHHRDAFATTALIVRPPDNLSSQTEGVLVVATTATVDFFQLPAPGEPPVNTPLIHTTNLTEMPVNPFSRIMSRGIATLPSKTNEVTVLTGTATGVIMMHTIKFLKEGERGAEPSSPRFSVFTGPSMQTPCCSITCIAVPSSAQQKRYNVIRWLCADDDGCICVYEKRIDTYIDIPPPPLDDIPPPPVDDIPPPPYPPPDDDKDLRAPKATPSICSALGWDRVALFAGIGVPCTGAAFLPDPRSDSSTPDYIVAAYTSGHIRLLSLVTNSIVAEIAAHSRSITALAVHPELPYAVSVSEDSWVRAWSLWHCVNKAKTDDPSGRHGRRGSSSSSDGMSSVDSSRMQKFDINQQWSAFMPFFMWTGVCMAPRILPSSDTSSKKKIVHDISVVAYDLGALFTFHAKSEFARTAL